MEGRLCELPTELLYNIVSFIKDRSSLCSLARASRRYQDLAETAIYKAILIRKTEDAWELRKAIQKRPERRLYIQDLNLRPSWYQNRKSLGYHMRYIVARCPNLKNFALESPTCNYGRWENNKDNWRLDEQTILKGLKVAKFSRISRVTLHLDGHNARYWDPNELGGANYCWSDIMALPSLTDLTVSCALIHDELEVAEPRSSNLRFLQLVECNVTIEGLRKMLAAPKALRKFHLGENAYHRGEGYNLVRNQLFNNLLASDPDAFIQALAQQSSSLEQFEYVSGPQQHSNKSMIETFGDFVRLQDIRLSEHVREDRCRRILSETPNLRRVWLEVPADKILKSIIQLEEEHGERAGSVGIEEVEKRLANKVASALFAEIPQTGLSSLQELHVVIPHGPISITGSRRTWIEMLSTYWRCRNVNLSIYYRDRTSIFPPVLYDEHNRAPKDILVYVTDLGFTAAAERLRDPWDFNLEFAPDGTDVLENFDFDSFLHNTDDWNGFGSFDFMNIGVF